MNPPSRRAGATDSLAVLGFIEADGRLRSAEATRNLTLSWFREHFGAVLPEDAATASRSLAESGSRRFLSTSQAIGKNSIWACWLDDPESGDPGTSSIIEAAIWSDGNRVQRIGFRLLSDVSVEGNPHGPRNSGIVEQIDTLCDLHAAVTGMPPRFEFVRSEDQVRKLADHLLDGQRRSAVIVLSTRRNAGTARATALDAKAIAAGTSGLASVYVIASDWTRHLTHLIGKRLAVFNGAVRVYLPGLKKDEDPKRHELHCIGGKPTAESREQAWRRLRQLVAEQSTELYRSQRGRIPYSALKSEMIALKRTPDSQRPRQRSMLERIGAPVRSGLAWAKRHVTIARQALARIRRIPIVTESESLRFELASVKRKLQESERSRRRLARQLSDERRKSGKLEDETVALKASLQGEAARAEELARSLARYQLPTRWKGIIGWCEQQFGGKLLLHPALLRDLGRAQYEDVSAAARGLAWLAEDYRLSRLNGRGVGLRGSIPDGRGIRNERCGGDSFELDWQGRTHSVEWHLRKGDRRDPRHCLRIYYFWDPALEQVVVADMPAHRESAS